MSEYLINAYNQLQYSFATGDGVWLYDLSGKKYLDSLCGIAVTGLGHNHPKITKVIKNQAEKLLHTSNLVNIPEQEQLAEKLSEVSGMKTKAFFNCSGSEAVETAIKLSRLYGQEKGISEPKIAVMSNSFHGRTIAAITAGGNKKVQAGFQPLLSGFLRVKFNDLSALEHLLSVEQDLSAVMLEPIQGEGGIRVADLEYLIQVRKLCDKYKVLMIVDEVQCGMGRTGKMFAYQHAGIQPDVITLAKGLGNGIPIGACLVAKKYADLFKPGSHGSTFGGNPFSCAVALATVREIHDTNLLDNVNKQSELLITGLKQKLYNHKHVVDIRGKGLMIGLELDRPCRDILNLAFDKGLVFNITQNNIIRLLPPLIIQSDQINFIVDLLPELIDTFVGNV